MRDVTYLRFDWNPDTEAHTATATIDHRSFAVIVYPRSDGGWRYTIAGDLTHDDPGAFSTATAAMTAAVNWLGGRYTTVAVGWIISSHPTPAPVSASGGGSGNAMATLTIPPRTPPAPVRRSYWQRLATIWRAWRLR